MKIFLFDIDTTYPNKIRNEQIDLKIKSLDSMPDTFN